VPRASAPKSGARRLDPRPSASASPKGARRRAARIFAVVGLVILTFFFGITLADATDVITLHSVGSPEDPPASPAARMGAAAPDDLMHALAAAGAAALTAAGLIGLMMRPAAFGFGLHVAAAAMALVATGLIVGDPDNRGGQAGVLDPLTIILATPLLAAAVASPSWSWSWRERRRPQTYARATRTRRALVLLGAVGFAWAAVDQALQQRNTFPPAADPHHNAHWWTASVASAVIAALSAVGLFRHQGWRIGTFLSGLAAVGAAGVSLLRPGAASALPTIPAAAAAIWGLALVSEAATHGD